MHKNADHLVNGEGCCHVQISHAFTCLIMSLASSPCLKCASSSNAPPHRVSACMHADFYHRHQLNWSCIGKSGCLVDRVLFSQGQPTAAFVPSCSYSLWACALACSKNINLRNRRHESLSCDAGPRQSSPRRDLPQVVTFASPRRRHPCWQ